MFETSDDCAHVGLALVDLNSDGWRELVTGAVDCGGAVWRTIKVPVCGNGLQELGEGCDDKNTDSGDGCSATCQPEVLALTEVLSLQGTATDVALGDVNGDGFVDLAIARPPGADVYLGDGAGLLSPWWSSGPWSCARLALTPSLSAIGSDMVVAPCDGGAPELLQSDGDDLSPVWTGVSGAARAVGFADMDADGVPDLVLVNDGAAGAVSSVTVRDPSGLPQGTIWLDDADRESLGFASTDIGNNGKADLALGAPAGGELRLLQVAPGDELVMGWTRTCSGACAAVAWGDPTADQLPDLALSDGAEVLLHAGTSASPFLEALPLWAQTVAADVTALALADLDGDGDDDLIVGTAGDGVKVFRVTSPLPADEPDWSEMAGCTITALATADLNGDGVPDLAASASDCGTRVYLAGSPADGP